MEIVSLCPFVASTFAWQARGGAHARTVIVKATFVLAPGTSTVAASQEPVFDRDQFWENDPRRSLRVASDRVPYKPRADVTLVGHAYAPGKLPVRSLATRFVVGDVDKSIDVWCDRKFRVTDAQLLEGQRFTKMPLCWERASGGPDSSNPVGKPFDATPDAYGTISIAHLQPAGCFVSKRSDRFVSTCYAPIAPTWPGRIQRLSRLSRMFIEGRWEDSPFPADFDPTFFQSAPPDQIVAEIRANERMILEHLHPEHARLVTSLPGLRPRAIVDRATGEREEVSLVADTLWVDTDRGTCSVVWRGRIGLRTRDERGRIAVWIDELSQALPVRPRNESPGTDVGSLDATATIVGCRQSRSEPALPFVAGASSLAHSQPLSVPKSTHPSDTVDDAGSTTLVAFGATSAKALPFEHIEQPSPPATTTAAPFVVALPFPMSDLRMDNRAGLQETLAPEPELVTLDAPDAVNVEVAPPPMIGPLAKADMPTPEAATQAEPEPIVPKRSVVQDEPEEPFCPDAFPLEKCAALTASIARAKPNKNKILEGEELTETKWEAIQAHWIDAIRQETKRGKKTLLDRFDQAYVAQLEKERGPITVEEYARLSVAGERGTQDEVLEELGLPKGAVMRVERVWMKKCAWASGLQDSANEAVERAREE